MNEEAVKATYSNDQDRGPGYGLLHINDARLNSVENVRLCLKRGTDHYCLAPGGWQPAETLLPVQRVIPGDDGYSIAIGPEIVDHLDTRENYRLSLVCVDGSTIAGALRVPELLCSPVTGGQGIGVAAKPAPQPAPAPPLPAPVANAPAAVEQTPPEQESGPAADLLLPPEPRPGAHKRTSFIPLIIAALVLALAGGSFAVWKVFFNKEEAPVVAEKNLPPQQEEMQKNPAAEPPQVAPKTAIVQAREHLGGPAVPEESLKLAKGLGKDRDGIDASFLLLEDAAQKGNAEAMILTGGYFDPADVNPSGSIQKDPATALVWYKKAKAAGNQEADARIASLRAWVQTEAAKGSAEAQNLLRQFQM